MSPFRKFIAVSLAVTMLGIFSPTMADKRYFTFGANPVDPTRGQTLKPGECVLVLQDDSPFPVTVKARHAGTDDFSVDTAYIRAGEEIVVNSDGVALYAAVCGNIILEPLDWRPAGQILRCEPRVVGESHSLYHHPSETVLLEVHEPRKKRRWLWIAAGIVGVAVGAYLVYDDDHDDGDVDVDVRATNCHGNCPGR